MTPSEADRDPRRTYEERLAARRHEAERLAVRDGRLSNLRLGVFAGIVALAFGVFGADRLDFVWLLPPVALFAALLLLHDRVIRAREAADRAVAFYELGLARLDHAFAGRGEAGERLREEHHPFADDLDLFGRGSLYELLCTARTRAGEDRLARWLLEPAPPEEVRERQRAVRELRDRLDLREDLGLLGQQLRAGLHAEAVRAWGEREPVRTPGWLPALGAVLSGLGLGGLALWVLGAGPLPFAAALLLQGAFAAALRGRVQRMLKGVDTPSRDLALLAALLERLEVEPFESPRMAALRAGFETAGVPASRRIARFGRLVELLDARRNQLFAPIGALMLWTTQLALAIERWRQRCGPCLAGWIEAVGECEALLSLASHDYENPQHVFPELEPGQALFEAEALGHPLLPEAVNVRNDVSLGGELRLLVISGSNMSGKSTFLRTVGINAVLAQAGASVRARRLRLTPLAVGASIRVQDSLQEGASRFYAEIKRLREVMERAEGPVPTLFLLDEILHGTNSHDRGIGAEAVVRGLLERGAIGAVTTHDLALARLAETLEPRARNVHFQDHLEEGRIAFDYRMHEGVVTHSNALALMRAVGLEV